MSLAANNPLIVQSDRTLMLQTVISLTDETGQPLRDAEGRPQTAEHPRFAEARELLSAFAELEKSPDYLHTYRVTPVSVWNAAALGLTVKEIEARLHDLSCVPIPPNVLDDIRLWIARYGSLRIENVDGRFLLTDHDSGALTEVLAHRSIRDLLEIDSKGRAWVSSIERGVIKQALIKLGYPVDDRGGYVDGDAYPIELVTTTKSGDPFALRAYQSGAAEAFYRGGSVDGGNGVVVLPCGAGKTVVGLAAMNLVGTRTLILTTNTVAVHQWRNEVLDKTSLTEDEVGEYTGEDKHICPVTITTYQMLTWRRSRTADFEHMGVFSSENWGLVIYDEVHLLPAPIFRVTAALQARRRLGLTATLVREDGKEDEVFCLIGPKRYEVPWKVLENQGFIATARCVEVRVQFKTGLRNAYASADARKRFRLSSENPAKIAVVERLIERHADGRILVIGQYLDQLNALKRKLRAPLITGKTPNAEREKLYAAFKSGQERVLIVSKVGNFAIDLPDANVAIEVSGSFGSRQEEAQRLGRILRPKSDGSNAWFYAVVTQGSRDQEFAERRQLFLTEQGYTYEILDASELDNLNTDSNHGAETP